MGNPFKLKGIWYAMIRQRLPRIGIIICSERVRAKRRAGRELIIFGKGLGLGLGLVTWTIRKESYLRNEIFVEDTSIYN